jgi:BlaI family transcriptional regulator, penicillinase repressor
MPRKPSTVFTDKELEIMKVVWQMGEATVKEIQGRLPGDPHYNSVLTIIRVLERKGHLVHRAEGKTYFYRAGESKEKARARLLRHLVDQVFGGSAASVVLNLVQAGDLTPKDLDDIRGKIARMRKEKKDGGNG